MNMIDEADHTNNTTVVLWCCSFDCNSQYGNMLLLLLLLSGFIVGDVELAEIVWFVANMLLG